MSSSMTMNEEEEEERKIISYLNSFPTGYRFNPTDEELINAYLKKKLQNAPLPTNRMKDVDLYKNNPWDLTAKFTSYGENEYYFFTRRNRKYATGSREIVKRVAGIGHWKGTGKATSIYDSNGVEIGSKRLLVFYEGTASNGNKTPWVMLEYKAIIEDAEGTTSGTTDVGAPITAVTRSASTGGEMQLDEWVLCKIYKKKEEEPAATPPQQAAAPPASATPIESREELNDEEDMFNIEEYLDIPAGEDSLELLDP